MTGFWLLQLYKGKDDDILKIMGICLIMDLVLGSFFLFSIPPGTMWIVYAINLTIDIPFVGVEKKISGMDNATYISLLIPDILCLVFALASKIFR